jgi:organic hydroperoxide reductase OsmC/OhrA
MKSIVTISWRKSPAEIFVDSKYSRVHHWIFDGGMQLNASSSPDIVPLPMSNASLVDPEEAFLASLSSCHMLFFLSFCAKHKYVVTRYEDQAQGIWGKREDGKKQLLLASLHPVVQFEGNEPSSDVIHHLHELAHENCYIANSVKTKIEIC